MKKSIKAALFSALAFPGCGHFILRHYRSGVALLAISLGALAIVMSDAIKQANIIANKILASEIPLDAQTITDSVEAANHAASSPAATIAMWVLSACWLVGIVDAYRIGRNAPQ
jgi:hypothetical protein